MKPRKCTETWQKTRKPNLLRHKSGRYYARALAGSKEVWKSPKTSHYSVAQAKLAEFLEEHRKRVRDGHSEVSPKMTFGYSGRPRNRHEENRLLRKNSESVKIRRNC